MLRGSVAVAVLVAVLVGCTAPPLRAPDGEPETSTDATSASVALVGMWRVSAGDEHADTWLRLDAGGFTVWRECGFLSGSWAATETAFLAEAALRHQDCGSAAIPWLDTASEYRAIDGGWELRDHDGVVTATLRVDGVPPPHPDLIDSEREVPEITPEVRELLRRPAPLPEELDPANASRLLGAWTPLGIEPGTTAGASFEEGRWTASDGCNVVGGRWAVDESGTFLSTSGVSTQIGCRGAPVPGWIATARTAGFDGDDLVLRDVDGAELGRLVRA